MARATGIPVSNKALRSHAEELLARPVALDDLALAFDEASAATAEVLVEGDSFYPPMLADIESAQTSVHINQFGFRPGVVGDRRVDPQGEGGRLGAPRGRPARV
jgi:hypothetical protein